MNLAIFIRRQKKLLLVILVFIVIVIGALWYFSAQKKNGAASNNPTKSTVQQGQTVVPNKSGTDNLAISKPSTDLRPQPPEQQFYDIIANNTYIAPNANGQVQFGITKIVQPLPGWFIVTVTMPGVEPNQVIMQETGTDSSSLTIVAGPGTDFPPDTVSLPDAVRKAL